MFCVFSPMAVHRLKYAGISTNKNNTIDLSKAATVPFRFDKAVAYDRLGHETPSTMLIDL